MHVERTKGKPAIWTSNYLLTLCCVTLQGNEFFFLVSVYKFTRIKRGEVSFVFVIVRGQIHYIIFDATWGIICGRIKEIKTFTCITFVYLVCVPESSNFNSSKEGDLPKAKDEESVARVEEKKLTYAVINVLCTYIRDFHLLLAVFSYILLLAA